MPYRRGRIPVRKIRGYLKHAETYIGNLGPASAPVGLELLVTEGGARTVDGSQVTFTDFRDTGETVNVGDIVKYINIFLQAGPKAEVTAGDNISTGWLEYAVVCTREDEPVIPITNMGTETLGVVANRMFPQSCLRSGFISLGGTQANGVELHLKIPPKLQKIRQGYQWKVWLYFRSSSSTATGTDKVKYVASMIYKGYV